MENENTVECYMCGEMIDLTMESLHTITLTDYIYGTACSDCAEQLAKKILVFRRNKRNIK